MSQAEGQIAGEIAGKIADQSVGQSEDQIAEPGEGRMPTQPGEGHKPTPEEIATALGLPAPTPEQSRVIAHPLTPLLVVAGAGSGKTATMSQRVVYLVATKAVRPDEILGLTFTRKATGELAQRVAARLNQLSESGLIGALDDDPEPTISTYDSFAGTIVREHGLRIGVDPDATLITEASAWQIVSELIETRTEPLPVESLSSATKAVLRLDGALSENLLEPEQAATDLEDLATLFEGLAGIKGCKTKIGTAPANMRKWHGILEATVDYREYKRAHGLLNFGDQIALACRIAQEYPEVSAQLRARYPAVLLDEFQDTSVAQLRLLSALFADSGVTAVGDPHQAIYGWRGASAGALDTFHARFNPAGSAALAQGQDAAQATPVLPLSTAWRNDVAILQAANLVSSPLRHHTPVPGDAQIEHIPVEPLRPRPDQVLAAEAVAGPGSAVAGKGSPGLMAAAFLQDPLQEAQTIADFLTERWHPQAQMAVLCRARSQFAPIAQALQNAGLPVSIVGLGGMLSVPEVADLRALVCAAADPEQGESLLRLLTGAGIGAADLAALYRLARELSEGQEPAGGQGDAPAGMKAQAGTPAVAGVPAPAQASQNAGLWEREAPLLSEALEALARDEKAVPASELSDAGRRIALRLAGQLRAVRSGLHLAIPELLGLAEQVLDLDIEVAARFEDPMGRRALDAFHATAEQYCEQIEAPTLGGFLIWLEAAQEHENGMETPQVEPEPGAVQLLTMHASKGLEWDTVVVAGMAESQFPSYRSTLKDDFTLCETDWMTSLDSFPHPLRADAQTLPPFELGMLEPGATDKDTVVDLWEQYTQALGRHTIAEERRLAYVAITRARHEVLLTGSYLNKTSKTPKQASRFLTELRRRDMLTPYGPGWMERDEEATNPLVTQVRTSWWPAHPKAPATDNADGDAGGGVTASAQALAAARLAAARAVQAAGCEASRQDPGSLPQASVGSEPEPRDELVSRWQADAALLLAERERAAGEPPAIRIPEHLAATRLDELRTDPAAFALNLRRPLPSEPSATGRLGTVFHEAIAQRLAASGTLLSLQEAGIAETLSASDRRRIERWLATAENIALLEDYVLVDTEVDRELSAGGTVLRCRIDAVFQHVSGEHWLIVDWKTGRRRVPVDQLSIYVHAWAASKHLTPEAVRAAYIYVDEPGGLVAELSPDDVLSLDQIAANLTNPNAQP